MKKLQNDIINNNDQAENINIKVNKSSNLTRNDLLKEQMGALVKSMIENRYMIYSDTASGLFYAYDLEEDKYQCFAEKEQLFMYTQMAGFAPFEAIPSLKSIYDPTDFIKINEAKGTVNLFTPTSYMYMRPNQDKIDLQAQCPYTWLLIDNLISSRHEPDYENCRKWFINWLAASFQSRTKCQTAVLFLGPQGTGKNMFYELVLTPFYGTHNVHLIENKDVDNAFNGQWENKMLLILNEIAPNRSERIQVQSMLKSLVTDKTISINEKFVKQRTVPNYANIIFFSDLGTPINIDLDDRRYTVFRTDEMLKTKYENWSYVEWQDAIISERETFYQYLMNYPVDYQAIGTVYPTLARTAAMENAASKLDIFINALNKADKKWFKTNQTACLQIRGSEAPPPMVVFKPLEYAKKRYEKNKVYRMYLNCFPEQRLSMHKLTSMLKSAGWSVIRPEANGKDMFAKDKKFK